MNDIIKIMKSLQDSGVSISGVTEKVKHEAKKQDSRFPEALLATLAASLVQPVISSVVKVLVEEELKEKEEDIQIKILSSTPSFNGVFSRRILPRIRDGAMSQISIII